MTDGLALSTGDGTKYYLNIDYAPLNDLKSAILNATGSTPEALPAPKHKPHTKTGVPDIIQATINTIFGMKIPTGKKVIQ